MRHTSALTRRGRAGGQVPSGVWRLPDQSRRAHVRAPDLWRSPHMKFLLARGSAALLIAATALTAACANNDPTAPAAPTAARAPQAAGPVHSSGYMVAWGKDGGQSGTTPTNGSGYMVGWGKDGNTGGASTTGSGYMVAWGKDGGSQSSGQ